MADYLNLAMEETPRYQGAPAVAPYRVSTAGIFIPTTAGRINAVPSHIDRTNELRGITGAVPLVVETFAPEGSIAERAYVNNLAFLLSLSGYKATITPGDGTLAVWTLATAAATAGTYTLTVGGQTTTALAWNATTAQIQAALEALSTVGVGNVLVAGGPLPGTNVTITFRKALAFQTLVVSGTFTGLTGGPYTISNTTPAVVPTVTSPDWVTGDTFATAPTHYIGTGSYKYVFAPRVGAQAQTAQIIAAYGTMGLWLQGQGFGVSGLSLSAAGELAATLMGLVVSSVSDPGLSPVYDSQSVLPVRRGDLTLTWLSGSGVVDDFSLAVANPLQQVRSLSLATPSLYPDIMEVGDAPIQVSGSIPMRRFAAADFAALLAGTTFSAKARWLSPSYVGNSNAKYGVWCIMPSCQYRAGTPDDLYNRRRFGASFDWWAAYDETAGYDAQFALVCGVPAASLSAPFTI